ncbi:MAG: hypothetical protein ACREQX_13565, partial [Candidatus Binataceae bacterium]
LHPERRGKPRGLNIEAVADSGGAAAIISTLVQRGDVLLVKGSRGLAMERVIAALDYASSAA